MRGRLWCLRLVLLVLVSAVVFSPLAVRGASISSQPVGWNHDPSALLLPSAPTYPMVLAYRDIRMRMAERSFEKAELFLTFANQDAAAISTMARRQDFVSSANHASAYQQTFDRCVGWLVIANERGNDVSYLLARVMNDHIAQQVALGTALATMPDWSQSAIQAARNHAVEVVVEAIRLVEGVEAAQSYVHSIGSMLPELELPDVTVDGAMPSDVVTTPQAGAPAQVEGPAAGIDPEEPWTISTLRPGSTSVAFGESVKITCLLSPDDDDDGLRFSWWCSRGDLVASRTRATWTAPNRAGVQEISVTVIDELGRSETRTIEIDVLGDTDEIENPGDERPEDLDDDEPPLAAASPEIFGITVTADHTYLEDSLGGGYSILISRTCTMRCSVSTPDKLDIDWTITGGGRLNADGDTAVFEAPSQPGYSRVTVTTTNRDGEQDSVTLTFYVTTCTYCF